MESSQNTTNPKYKPKIQTQNTNPKYKPKYKLELQRKYRVLNTILVSYDIKEMIVSTRL